MNIVDAIKGQLSGELLGKLGSILGVSEGQLKSALDAGVPGLLSLLAGVASTAGGAEKLAESLKQVDQGADGGLGDILSGKDLSQLQEKGLGWLNSILGSAALPVIVSLLGKFAAVGPGQLRSLLGMLAPLILGVIARQLSGKPLDSQTVSSFFEGQKANIDAALPAGLSFAEVPGIGGLSAAAASVAGSARSTAAAVRDEAAGMPAWLLPLLGMIVVGGLAWYFLSGPGATGPEPEAVVKEAAAARPIPGPTKGAPAEAVAPGAESLAEIPKLTKDLGSAYASLTEILGGVKDAKSADAAVPGLGDLAGKVDGYKAIFDKLNEAGKAAIAKVTTEHLSKLNDLADVVRKVPGLPDKFKEVLQAILTKLAAFKAA